MKSIFTGKRFFVILPLVLVTLFGFRRLETAPALENTTSESPKINKHFVSIPYPTSEEPTNWVVPSVFTTTPGTSPSIVPALDDNLPTAAFTATLVVQNPPTVTPESPAVPNPSLDAFVQQVVDGQAGEIRGLYVDGILALRIVQQPPGNPGFISREDGTATQFESANLYNAVGLLAHNFLSGRDFFQLKAGQVLTLVHGDGSLQSYRVTEIADFQRLNPVDVRSNFLDLENNQEWTTQQVFARFYQRAHYLTLQTCIQRDGNWSWGVRFISAEPLQSIP